MKITEYQQFDALGLADLVKRNEVSPAELLHVAAGLAEQTQDSLNAVAYTDTEHAKRNSELGRNGIFYGVPFLVKELLPYHGLPMTMGSRLFATHVPEAVPEFSRRIAESGLMTFGNTTSSEFGLLGSTETLLHGATLNPWDRSLSAAGSSGGSAAAVAAGIVPMAHANDAGGSIRIPASVCGLFGLMPSAGRCVPAMETGGPFAELISDHCISKSVRDSAAFLSITEDKGSPERKPRFPPVGMIREHHLPPLRIGVYTRSIMGEEADPEVCAVVRKTRQLCEELGHETISIDGPVTDGSALSLAFFTLAGFTMNQVSMMMEPVLQHPVDETIIEPFTFELIQWFRTLEQDALPHAMEVIQNAARAMLKLADNYDVLLCPTLVSEPKPLGYLSPQLDRETLIARTEHYAGYTPIHNISGMCAMSVPLFTSSSGLPVGSHFAAKPGAEATLLGIAYQLENAAPWSDKLPHHSQYNIRGQYPYG